MTEKQQNKLTLFFLLLLILSAVLRVILSIFPKAAVTYNDELFYLELSQNIFLRGSLNVYGTPLHFTKLLYPLLLSPFHAVSDGVLRTQLISAFNALLVSSALIPGYLLARRILKKNWQVILSLLVLAFSPNLLFSLTFMAENLYLPLVLWGFYAAYRFFTSERKPFHAFLLGVLGFLLYFAKEVGAAWIAAVAVALAAGLLNHKTGRKEALLSLGCFIAGVLVPFLFTRFVLLSGMTYSYSAQVSADNLAGASRMMYLLYASGILLLFFLLSAGFFPVALPAVRYKKLAPANQSLFLLSLCYVLFVTLGVAFGVSLYADFPRIALRIHLRYFLGAVFPFLLLGLAAAEETEPFSIKNPLTLATAGFACLLALFLFIPSAGSLVDFPVLQFTKRFDQASSGALWLWKLVPIILLAVILILLSKKRARAFACLLLPLMLVLETASGVVFVQSAKEEEEITDAGLIAEAQILDRHLDTADGTVLVLSETAHDPELRAINTIMNDDYAFATFSGVRETLLQQEDPAAAQSLPLGEGCLPDTLAYYTGSETLNLDSISQIVTVGEFSLLDPEMNEEITPEGLTWYHVYRAKDPSRLSMLDPSLYLLDEEIFFYGADAPFRNFRPTGFSHPENGFTWTNAEEASLTFRPDVSEPVDLRVSWAWRMTIGEQACQVFANDVPVLDAIITGSNDYIFFTVPADAYAETGSLTLRFLFPDARQPGNGDSRTLAVAFESIMLSEK